MKYIIYSSTGREISPHLSEIIKECHKNIFSDDINVIEMFFYENNHLKYHSGYLSEISTLEEAINQASVLCVGRWVILEISDTNIKIVGSSI
jgi:hypothetical protein